jgi:catechol 2,3-dioxygenase-like lactoylglutathione lyase family enzyme
MTTTKPHAIGGLHEACFGVPDLDAAAAYWRAFGFAPIATGSLGAEAARTLYGVHSALESVRLRHLDADHGLVRLMRWAEPLGIGIGIAPLRAHGSRWVGQFVRSVLDIANHGAAARRAGMPLMDIAPSFIDLSAFNPQLFGGHKPQPFRDRLLAVREYTLIQPLWRQALLERFHYDSPLLGRIDDQSLLRASQIVNASMMITSDDPAVYSFYERVLGLKAAPVQEVPWEQAMASRGVFDLRDGETHWLYTYEEPRSGATADTRRSGRLYLFRFLPSSALPDRRAVSQPGHFGCTLYTWRVRELARFRAACRDGGCTQLGELLRDEFATEAFRCVTPDGMSWAFQQASGEELKSLST